MNVALRILAWLFGKLQFGAAFIGSGVLYEIIGGLANGTVDALIRRGRDAQATYIFPSNQSGRARLISAARERYIERVQRLAAARAAEAGRRANGGGGEGEGKGGGGER